MNPRKFPVNNVSGQSLDSRGEVITLTISRAWNVDMSSETEDLTLSKYKIDEGYGSDYFFITPHMEGGIVVELQNAGEGETYTIDSSEVKAYLGAAMNYRVRKVLKEGTICTNFSIGY